ncbi:MAG: hypothetical protein WBO24_02150 [Nitrospirales bacterium]
MFFTDLLFVIFKGLRIGGIKVLIAEKLLLKHQLLLVTGSRKSAPNLSPLDRGLLGFWTLVLHPPRIKRAAFPVKPSTLLRYHHALVNWKDRLLYLSSEKHEARP